MPSGPSATPSAMAQTPAPTISTCCCASVSSGGRWVQRASRGIKAISSRISGAYSGATFSPSVARIIFSISSLPGSVTAGLGSPLANSFTTAARISSWLSRGKPASGSGIRRTSRRGLYGGSSQRSSPVMWTSTISSTRISPSAIAEARSSFLRGISTFIVVSLLRTRGFAQAAIGGPGGARDKTGIDRQVDAGHTAAHRREQPGDGLRDLGRFNQPVHRRRSLEQALVECAGGNAGFERDGAGEAWRDGIDAYAGAAPFGSQRLRDLDDAGFRGGIGVDRAGRHARNRGDIDDGAMPPLGHFDTDAAGDKKSAAQVDIDLAVPLLHPHALDRMHLAEHA